MPKLISRAIVILALTLPVYSDRVSADTTAQHRSANNLLNDNDRPETDLFIDVTVMEVSRERLRTLGATPHGAETGNFAISTSKDSVTSLTNDKNTAIILQKPQILALNNEEATLKIGDRLPIAIGSYPQFGIESPLLTTQFRYVDVGVNMDITPHLESANEVTLKMALNISSVTGSQTIGVIKQPVIGQRRIEREVRIADGDVYLLGSILEPQETQSLSGYPWVNKTPVLRYLFGQDNKEHTENEIVFAFAPHVRLR